MEKLQWFKFTPSDWMMGKIQRCPEITQSRFIRLCCMYWNKSCELLIEDAEVEIDKEHLDVLISKKIVSKNEDYINISFLDEQFMEIKDDSKGKSQSGIIGNLKRWHPDIYKKFSMKDISLEEAVNLSKSIAHQSQPDSTPIAKQSQNIADKNRQEKSREEKKRVDNKKPTQDEVVSFFIENGYKESSAITAFRYYNESDWTDRNGKKVINWKQKMRGVWFKPDNEIKKNQESDNKYFINENGYKIQKGII